MDASTLLTDKAIDKDRVYLCGKNNIATCITDFEPISSLTNKPIPGTNYYGDPGTVGVRPANDKEIMAKVNEIVQKVNLIMEIVSKHIIGGK